MLLAAIRDRFSSALLIIILQGAATCVPWKAFMTETDFLNFRARQGASSPVFAHNFASFNVLACMIGNVLGFLLYIPLHHLLSLDAQVLWPQLLTVAILVGSMVLTQMSDISGNVFMAIILTFQFVIGLTNATITGGVYNMAGWLPSNYIQGMSLGMGLSGMGVAAASLLTEACTSRAGLLPSSQQVGTAALYYFGGAAVMIVISIVTYFVFFQLPFVHSHSIPEVLEEWTVTCPVNEVQTQPKSLTRASASYLRLKTRNSSTNSLAEALSKSLSVDERIMFLGKSFSADFDDLEAPLLDELDEGNMSDNGRTKDDESQEPTVEGASSQDNDASPSSLPRLSEAEAVPQAGVNSSGRKHIQQHRPLKPSILGGETSTDLLWNPGGSVREQTSPKQSGSYLDGDLEELQEQEPSLGTVVRQVWGYNLVIASSCVLTMSVFPGVTSYICSVRNLAVVAPCHSTTPDGRLFGDLYVPFMFLVCNFGDVAGRMLVSVGPWGSRPPGMTAMVVYSLLRVPLAALILFSNVVTAELWRLPRLIRSDSGVLALAFMLCATGGHIQSLVFTHAPTALPKSAHDRLGPLINFAVAIGTTLGCAVSLLLTYSLQRE